MAELDVVVSLQNSKAVTLERVLLVSHKNKQIASELGTFGEKKIPIHIVKTMNVLCLLNDIFIGLLKYVILC